MQYFKHSELVNTYHVSLKTVHNWIDASKQGKLKIALHTNNGRTYIVNSNENLLILKDLAEKGKKYRNSLYHKTTTPTARFYQLYSKTQILDIISNLEIHREIPRQYNYFDQGASSWERFANQQHEESAPNLLKASIELLKANYDTIDRLTSDYDRVNIIDIGPGNAMPVRELLGHLQSTGRLHRYIAIDISQEMLNIAERNIKEWFGDTVQFEGHVRDIVHERFDDVIVDEMLDKNSKKVVNVALLLGATLMNFQSPYELLNIIYRSLGHNDLLIYTDKPDTEAERRYFAVNAEADTTTLSPKYGFIFDLLNIDPLFYTTEMGFNPEKRVRYIRVRFNVDLTIKFECETIDREVTLSKGDTILAWRAWHQSPIEIIAEFEKRGFALLQSTLTKDRQYFLTISGIETKEVLEV